MRKIGGREDVARWMRAAWFVVVAAGVAGCTGGDDVAERAREDAGERTRATATRSVATSTAAAPSSPGSRTSAPASAMPSAMPSATSGPSTTLPTAASPSATPAASATATATTNGAGATRRGKRGLWIWELDKNGPGAERAAELAALWGVGRVFIKSGNGDGRERWARNFRAENRAPFHRRGIEVWAFAYVYGEGVADASGRTWGTIDEQVDAVADATVFDDVAGLVVDAEIELDGRPRDAERICAGLRARLGARQKLAYTSFGWIQKFRRFPFEELDRGCGDAFLPQVYFAHGWPGGAEGSLERMREGIRARGLRAPVWPVQTNMPNPDVATLQKFFDLAGDEASVFFLHTDDTEQTRRLGKLRWLD